MEEHIPLFSGFGDAFAISWLQFRIIISIDFLHTKSMLRNSPTSQWDQKNVREEGSVKIFLEKQFVYAVEFPLPSHPEGEVVLVLQPCPPVQRGTSVEPESLAIASHSCKTQRTAPALVYKLKAVATEHRCQQVGSTALPDVIAVANVWMFPRNRYGPYRRQSAWCSLWFIQKGLSGDAEGPSEEKLETNKHRNPRIHRGCQKQPSESI